jgi:aminodeoxyfutalosine synthase
MCWSGCAPLVWTRSLVAVPRFSPRACVRRSRNGSSLAYHPDNNELGEQLGRQGTATTGFDDLKNLAVGRLFLDNFQHIKTHWVMNTAKVSQVALHFGVDDLEGTVVRERIYHEAGAHTPEGLTFREIIRLVRDAGKRPVERNARYDEIREWT